MLDITELYCSHPGIAAQTPRLVSKLGVLAPTRRSGSLSMAAPKPLVIWQVTRSCGLNFLSCYSDSRPRKYGAELTTREVLGLIDGLGESGLPQWKTTCSC